MQAFARKLTVILAVAAIAFAHTLAPHRVLASHGATHPGLLSVADARDIGSQSAVLADQHASGTPCHGHDDAGPAQPGQAKPHDCCVAACHFIAMIDGATDIVLAIVSADVPSLGHAVLRDTPVRGLDPPPRIG